jgi:hypothetical protein
LDWLAAARERQTTDTRRRQAPKFRTDSIDALSTP